MAVAAFDWGGTSVKCGLWQDEKLVNQTSFSTPTNWTDMKKEMAEVLERYSAETIEGIGISAPGAVDGDKGVINGISAIPYIHHFGIQKELEELFDLPVAFENDANCAGIAEVWKGSAKAYQNVLFVVLGTGVGGAVIQEGKVMKGAHLYGGEFGLIFMNETQTFSQVGTAVKMAERYCDGKAVPRGTFSGQTVFELAAAGDELAQMEVDKFYDYVTRGLFSIQFTMDPECIVIGGGISAKEGLVDEINQRMAKLFEHYQLKDFLPEIVTCEFKNDANLIGAVANFYQKVTEKQ